MELLELKAFRDYVETHIDQIIDEAFLMFGSSSVLTHVANNKGKALIKTSSVNSDLVQKWKELGFEDFAQKVDMGLVEVESFRSQFKDKYVPEALEDVYIGEMRKPGQDPTDFPFEAYILQLLTKALAQFNEKVIWQSIKDVNSESGLSHYDGLIQQVTTAVTDTDITPIVFGTPYKPKNDQDEAPVGSTSIIDIVETLAYAMPEANRQMGLNIYMSSKNYIMYSQAYRNVFKTAVTTDKQYDIERTIVDGTTSAGQVNLIPVAGMGDSNRFIATPMWNAVYTYDVQEDASTFNMQKHFNALYIWGAFRYGSKFLIMDDNWMAVNELA